MPTLDLPTRPVSLICLAVAFLSIGGCGGNMKVAPVSGTVTLDGAPLERASVLFQPKAGGRPSFGVTDKSGKYTLGYSMNEGGAEVGSCIVKISTRMQAENPEGESSDDGERSPEKVPERYADEPIVVTVQPKNNTIDIALTTKP